MRIFTCLLSAIGLMAVLFTSGCATPAATAGAIGAGTLGVMVAGGHSPAHEIEQVYYLGSFDPQEQVQAQFYRITVHGQASGISKVKFGSGWVPAELIDSLTTHMSYNLNEEGQKLQLTKDDPLARLKPGRRLVQFGPEGFRESPANHRLCIVMGASPEAFFKAIDGSLGAISSVREEKGNSTIREALFKEYVGIQKQKELLEYLEADIKTEFKNHTSP